MDFHNRLENYKKNYQPLDRVRDKPHSYIRFFNVGEYIIANHCNGVLESDVVSFLLNTHLVPRKIWLCVHGETDFTTKGILGGDPPLNERGICFSRKLCQSCGSEEKERDRHHGYVRQVAACGADRSAARGGVSRRGERGVGRRSNTAVCCGS